MSAQPNCTCPDDNVPWHNNPSCPHAQSELAPASGSALVKTYWWPLWKHMHDAHGLTLVDDECNQIARAADESRLKIENAVAAILVNALRHLNDEQLVHLGHEIATRCGHTLVPNTEVSHTDQPKTSKP